VNTRAQVHGRLTLGFVVVLSALSGAACDQTVIVGRVDGDPDGGTGCLTPLLADDLAVGSDHVCVVHDGDVLCWGGGESGQRCDAATTNTPRPTSPTGFDTYTAVYAGGLNTCLRRSDGTLVCCGNNFDGTLGDGGSAGSSRPVEVIGSVEEAAMGFSSVYATRAAGTLTVWGANGDGQLGLGAGSVSEAVRTPTDVAGVAFEEVAASTAHACAVDAAGALFCTGTNTANELGIPLLASAADFTEVPAPTTFRSVSAGRRLSCAIGTGGGLYCWGRNEPTMIAGHVGDVDEPTRVGSESDYESVSVGFEHVCAIRTGGRLFCWGNGGDGRLGFEATATDTPTEVTPGVAYRAVRASFAFTCAIRSVDSAVVCFGSDEAGQLAGGDGSPAAPICLDP
jgi:alpha-tubulin suppressor-like RCC1 family protein